MLGENIQRLRKEKGLTQEELAIRLHVVRQTVSKWEKGLSVPDVETMQRIAQELDMPLGQLLGAEVFVEEDKNEIAEQLARINEQLAIKNRRARRVWKVIACVFVVSIVLTFCVVSMLGVSSKAPETESREDSYKEEHENEEVIIIDSNYYDSEGDFKESDTVYDTVYEIE